MADNFSTARAAVQRDMPDVANVPIEPMGWFGSALAGLKGALSGGQVQALTNPFTGSVSYDPAQTDQMAEPEIENMLTHELTHSRQAKGSSWLQTLVGALKPAEPYGQQSDELQAFQAENDRALAQHQTPGQMPNFQGGGFRQRSDITLPALAGLKKASK